MPLFGHYISLEGLDSLQNYKYQACQWTKLDLLLNHWWEFVVRFVPLWVSPNVLTLLALICAFGSFVSVALFVPDLSGGGSKFCYLSTAICAFLYQTFDAIDGKQARRTGSSSPLGQIFDHGCDSLATVLLAVAAAGIVGTGSSLFTFVIVTFLQLPYFCFTWWELHTHTFRTSCGPVGVSEGQWALIVCALIASIFGGDVFQVDVLQLSFVPSIFVQLLGKIGLYSVYVSNCICVFLSITNFWVVVSNLAFGLFYAREKIVAFAQVVGCGVFVLFSFLFYTSGVMTAFPVWAYLLWTLSFGIISIRQTVSAACKQFFNPIQWPVIPFFFASFLLYFAPSCRIGVTRNQFYAAVLVPLTIWCVVYLTDLVVTTATDICDHLGIRCFTLPKVKA